MIDLNKLKKYRDYSLNDLKLFSDFGDDKCGVFRVISPYDNKMMVVIASSGDGWDHVSVSKINTIPSWTEMELIKKMFFHDHEVVVQYHVPEKDHVNNHNFCLHLWRPLDCELPRPPKYMV